VLPAGLSVRWLGTAGFVFTYAGTVLAIDPYLSRVPLWRYLTGPLKVDEASVRAALPHADCIVVGHSHFDHVMDVPSLALATGALVVGSSSTANLMRVSGVPEAQIVECVSRHTFEVGPFRVELVPSVHSEFALGHRVPYAGEIPCSCEFRGRGKDYRCGQVFGVHITVAGCTFYHLGSANLIDDEIRFRPVDVFLMGISGRHATDRFIPRVLKKVEPRVVVPMHHDNFFRPADAPLSLLPLTRFGRFVDETFAFHKDITVRALPIGGVLSPNSATVEAQP
jgi:L-ascorbate metabolism protein UlaG (beta-lactamase superfamily)